MASIVMAITHTILEVIMIKLECEACKIGFLDYLIVCYNGRLEWVPFISNFENIDDFE